jgi:hypothetical protein
MTVFVLSAKYTSATKAVSHTARSLVERIASATARATTIRNTSSVQELQRELDAQIDRDARGQNSRHLNPPLAVYSIRRSPIRRFQSSGTINSDPHGQQKREHPKHKLAGRGNRPNHFGVHPAAAASTVVVVVVLEIENPALGPLSPALNSHVLPLHANWNEYPERPSPIFRDSVVKGPDNCCAEWALVSVTVSAETPAYPIITTEWPF